MRGQAFIFGAVAALVSVAAAFAPAAAVAPVLVQAIPDTVVAEDAPAIQKYRDLNGIFDDLEDRHALAFTIQSNSNPALLTAIIDPDSALGFSLTPDAFGSATLVVRATDSEFLFVEDTLVVNVTPVNDIPAVVAAIPDTAVAEDSPAVQKYRDLNACFNDPEEGGALAFTIQSNSNPALLTAIIDPDSALGFSLTPDAFGAATLVVRATDSEFLFVENTLVVNVTPVNDPPVITTPIPDTVVLVDSPDLDNYIDLNDVFDDVENGSALTFSVQSNSDPAAVNVSIDADSALDIGFFPDTHGRATIVIRATDAGGLTRDETFVVSVHRSLWIVKADGTGDEPTIQATINYSFDGDTLLLTDGTYTGGGNRGINLGGRDLVIKSENGPESTIIDAQGADRIFLMDNVGPSGVLSGLTLTNGSQTQGACVKMSNGSPAISGVIFIDNAAGIDGGAIYCDAGSNPAIRDCVFIGNSAATGGAIYSNASSPVIERCTIVGSRATSGGAGVHFRNATTGSVSNTIIAFGAQGPGIQCELGSNPSVSCTDVFGNAGGDALCGTDGGGNFSADPRFCGDPASGDVYLYSNSPCAPDKSPCGLLVGARPVACSSEPDLVDTPGTLYPDVAFAGEPDLVLHIGIDNISPVGVMLETTSSIVFSDSVSTFTANLANRTYVPGNAVNFTATFSPATVPALIQKPAAYDLRLFLTGVDDSTNAYTATLMTAGRNAITIETPKIVVSTLAADVFHSIPGARDVSLLVLGFHNGYADARALDSLTVTNMTFGSGSPAELDGEIETLRLYDDTDQSGGLSAPDAPIAESSWVSGEALFTVPGGWSLPSMVPRNLIVAADVDSAAACDGDKLDIAVSLPAHVVFQGDTEVNQDFSPLYPLNSFGFAVIDGMASHQIGMTPTGADTLHGGAADVLLLTLDIPQNGYQADTLTALSVKDYAGSFTPADFSAVSLYRDDGDGVFAPASDVNLGNLAFSGDRFQITGLLETISPAARFFVAGDVAARAMDSHQFRPGLPLGAVEVISSNDGPVDAAVVSPQTFVFENPEVVEIASLALGSDAAHPGAADVRLLRLLVHNRTRQHVTLDTLALTNGTSGLGSPGDFDREISGIRLYHDDGDGAIGGADVILAEGLAFSSGALVITGLGLDIGPEDAAELLVAADIDSFCAADGDTLEVRVDGPAGVGLLEAYPVIGDFPAATPGVIRVDGMRAFQIAVHPVADSLVVTGGSNILLLDVGIPANGYAADTLRTLVLNNEGTATSEHFERIALYADGGDGVYGGGAGDDTHLGDLIENPADPGRSFMIAGLGLPLDAPCGAQTRIFASADISTQYSVAGTIRFSIPIRGVSVASENDGPTDQAVIESSLLLIPKPDQLTVFPYPVGDRIVHPTSAGNLNCGFGFYNGYADALTLQAMKLYQAGSASSAEIDSVLIYADADGDGLFNPAADRRAGAVAATGASYSFSGLNAALEPGKISYVFVTYDLPPAVTDASTIDIRLFDPSDLSVEPPGSDIEGEFPINSPGVDVVDGMIAAQIALGSAPAYNASPDDADIPALNLVIPANGIWPDILEYLAVENAGTAADGSDIASVRLWREAGGDPNVFDAGLEDPIDYLDWNGLAWRSPSSLGVSIPSAGLRCYVTFSVSAAPADGVTFRARIPVGGIEVVSGNDGPIDVPVNNPHQQSLSTDALIATLSADRSSYSVGQTIVLSMIVRNESPDTLFGVHPSGISLSGAGGAAPATQPDPPSLDIAPDESESFVWTWTAASAGDLSFCARAYSADSSEVSEETCTESVALQKRPAGVTISLENTAPSSVNRGQRGVKLVQMDADYPSADTLDASARLSGLRLRCEERDGAPLSPASVFDGIAFTESGGAVHYVALADSTNAVLTLRFDDPIIVPPGDKLSIGLTADISAAAAFASFVLEIENLADLGFTDANDGLAVAKSCAEAFPWATTPVAVNTPAESLLVDSPSGAAATVNIGQEDVAVFAVDFAHPGPPEEARIILNDLDLEFFDLYGAALPAGGVVKRIRVLNNSSILYDADVSAGAGPSMSISLQTPLVVSSGSAQSLDIRVDVRSVPQADGFYVVLTGPQSVVARDINTARIIAVGALQPSLRDFPFASDRIEFQSPVSAIVARRVDRLPASVLPSSRGVAVMDLIISNEDAADASSALLDSLTMEFSLAGGAAAFPGDYFSAVTVTHRGNTLFTESSLSGASPLVGCRLASPVVVAPAESETLCVYLDTKAVFSPAAVEVSVDQQGIVIEDANDGARIFAIQGEFPLVSGPVSLQMPASGVTAALVSRAPANVTTSETDIHVFDLVVVNGTPAGYTPVDLASVRVRPQGSNGEALNPLVITAGARLVTRDSTVVTGTLSDEEILFTLPAGLVRAAPGSSDTVSVLIDMPAGLPEATFRLTIEDSYALSAVCGVTAQPVTVSAAGGGFPMATGWIHVLGSDGRGAYTNYPNPFAAGRETTTITFYTDRPASVTLKVYTLWGAPVLTVLENDRRPAGLHQDVKWDGRNAEGDVVNNGVYYLVLEVRGDNGSGSTFKRKIGVIR